MIFLSCVPCTLGEAVIVLAFQLVFKMGPLWALILLCNDIIGTIVSLI